jgi:hypothetical protein
MTITVTYSHVVPTLRQRLCYEVHGAENATAKRDQVARFRAAWAFGEALHTIRRSADAKHLWIEGIMERDALPSQAVEQAAKFIGSQAAALLGLPEDDEEILRGLRAREEARAAATPHATATAGL